MKKSTSTSPIPVADQKMPRVLIAEHSKLMRQSLSKLLSKNFIVVEEESGEGAWRRLQNTRMNIVILDIDLPDFNGFGVLEQIRNSRLAEVRQLPVTLIGNNEKEERQAYEAGANGFICKPFDSQQLHKLLQNLLGDANKQRPQGNDQAAFDVLTGLPNRRYFDERGVKELAFARRYSKTLALLMFQIDHLEKIVDTHGSAVAKQLIKKLGNYIQSEIRNEDTVARISGRRFGVIAPATDEFGAKAIADRVIGHIRARVFNYGDISLSFTISAGLAAPRLSQIKTFSELFAITTKRLEVALAAGGDRAVFDSRSSTEAQANSNTVAQIDAEVEAAIDTGVHSAVHPAVSDELPAEKPQLPKTRKKEPPPTLEVGMWLLENGLGSELKPHYAHLLKEILPLLENANEAMGNELQGMLQKIKMRLLNGE